MISDRQTLDAATIVILEYIQQYDPEKFTVLDYNLIMTKICKHDKLYFIIKGFSSYEERRVTVGEVKALCDKIMGEIKSLCSYAADKKSDDVDVSDAVTSMNILNKVLTLCTLYLKNNSDLLD